MAKALGQVRGEEGAHVEAHDEEVIEAEIDVIDADVDLEPDLELEALESIAGDWSAGTGGFEHHGTWLDADGTAPLDATEDGAMLVLREAFRAAPLGEVSANGDPLSVYLARIRHHPVLEPMAQQKLAVRYRELGDVEAARILILTNLRLVVKIAREYRRRWTNLLELIQEGNVGLSEAIKRYDPYRQVKFTSYAQYWIRAMILNYLMNHFQPVRIGSTRAGRKLFYNLKKARAQLVREGFLTPSPALVAEKLGVSERDVIEVSQHLDVAPLSLEQNAAGYEDTTVGELLANKGELNPEELYVDLEFKEKVREVMEEFSAKIHDEREVALWEERLTALEPVTLSELGERFGVSKERIRQLEVRLKERFKAFIMQRLGSNLDAYVHGA